MLKILFALGAGISTTTSPCVLPVLPFLLSVAAANPNSRQKEDLSKPLLIICGFILAFVASVLVFGVSVSVMGLSQSTLRQIGTLMLFLSGVMLVIPSLNEKLSRVFDFLVRIFL